MKKKTIILVTLELMLLGVNTNAQMSEKPRVIAMTDGEIDDQCSMIRFLLFHNHLLHIDIKAQQADQGKFL